MDKDFFLKVILPGLIWIFTLFLLFNPETKKAEAASSDQNCTCKALERSARALERIERKLTK